MFSKVKANFASGLLIFMVVKLVVLVCLWFRRMVGPRYFYIVYSEKIWYFVELLRTRELGFWLASLEKIQALTLRSASEAIILGDGLGTSWI